MPHSFTNLLYHVVFSARNRIPCIDAELKDRLFAYLDGIARELGAHALKVGGAADHVHLFLAVPPTVALADLLRVVKTNSSRWVHETWPDRSAFGWQAGYAAFTVSESKREEVIQYIASQEKHHRRMSFMDELRALLRKHGIEWDERFPPG